MLRKLKTKFCMLKNYGEKFKIALNLEEKQKINVRKIAKKNWESQKNIISDREDIYSFN